MQAMLERYSRFHQKILVADQHATGFYQALAMLVILKPCGFIREQIINP
jgi:hypothetical protein